MGFDLLGMEVGASPRGQGGLIKHESDVEKREGCFGEGVQQVHGPGVDGAWICSRGGRVGWGQHEGLLLGANSQFLLDFVVGPWGALESS